MPASINLWGLVVQHQAILETLEEGEVTEEAEARFTELTEDLQDQAAIMVRHMDDKAAESDALALHIQRLTERKKRVDAARRRLKEWLARVMLEMGAKKLDVGTHKLSVQKSPPRVEVTCEGDLPSSYLRTTTVPDKAALKEALRGGEVIPGAILVSGPDYVRVT